MSSVPLLTPYATNASLLPDGTLPTGDRRIWSHTLTDLVAGFLRDGKPSRIAEAGGRALQLQDVSNAAERLLQAGVSAADVVLVEAYNDVTAVASILACWSVGCCVCPLDPESPVAVKDLIAQESGAKARVLSDGNVVGVPSEVAWGRKGLIRLKRPARVTGVDLALLIFTSGSSGSPKGVMLSHQNVMAALRSISAYLELRGEDRILSIPPLFFDYGLYQLLLALFDDCGLVLNGRQSSVVMLLKQIEQSAPTVLPVVPALASGLARMFSAVGKTAPAVRLITNTGGHLSDASIAALAQTFPAARIVPMYGLTECKRALFMDRDRYPGRNGSVGQPMPGLEAVVAVQEGGVIREARPSEVGELFVRGPSVMQGYHREQTGAGARIEPGAYRDDNWLATGDLFSTDSEGLLYFRGRSKVLIKQGGYCIYPRDIEVLAESQEGIETARVVGRQEDDGDESAVLFAQVAPGQEKEGRKRLLQQLKNSIPRTLMPRDVRFLEEWPATPNGKIDVAALMRLARDAGKPGK